MQKDFNLYKVDMKYIRNLHNIDDKVLSVSPQTGKDSSSKVISISSSVRKMSEETPDYSSSLHAL